MAYKVTLLPTVEIAEIFYADSPIVPPEAVSISDADAETLLREEEFRDEYILEAGVLHRASRRLRIKQIKRKRNRILKQYIPSLNNETVEMLQLLTEILPNNAKVNKVKAVVAYAQQRLTQAETATNQQLIAYDPETDIGWPL
jgi:hypothetical protein